MKKIIGASLLAGFLMVVVSFVFSILMGLIFPQIPKEYANANIFRSWSDPLMYLFFICPFITSFIFALLWEKHKNLLPGKTAYQKVFKLVMIYFIFSVLGMIITYSTFQVSLLMTVDWIISVFLQSIVGTWIISKMIK